VNESETYDMVFKKSLLLDGSVELESLAYQGVDSWDSVGHMALVAELEEAFSVSLEMDDVIDFESYSVGKEILRRYGVAL